MNGYNWTNDIELSLREIRQAYEEMGRPHEFYITPDVGHWYPDDLGERIDRAVAHIRAGG